MAIASSIISYRDEIVDVIIKKSTSDVSDVMKAAKDYISKDMDFGFIKCDVVNCEDTIDKLIYAADKIRKSVAEGKAISDSAYSKYSELINKYDIAEAKDKTENLRIEKIQRLAETYKYELGKLSHVEQDLNGLVKNIMINIEASRYDEDCEYQPSDMYRQFGLYKDLYTTALSLKVYEFRSCFNVLKREVTKYENKLK